MHDDESLAASRQPMEGALHPDIKLPAPLWAKGIAAPGGIPPMFAAGTDVRPPVTRVDALER